MFLIKLRTACIIVNKNICETQVKIYFLKIQLLNPHNLTLHYTLGMTSIINIEYSIHRTLLYRLMIFNEYPLPITSATDSPHIYIYVLHEFETQMKNIPHE